MEWFRCLLLRRGKKTALFEPFIYLKINILPRQARDKHGENSKKVPFSLRDWCRAGA
jgi:hypothetical protein